MNFVSFFRLTSCGETGSAMMWISCLNSCCVLQAIVDRSHLRAEEVVNEFLCSIHFAEGYHLGQLSLHLLTCFCWPGHSLAIVEVQRAGLKL